MNIRDKTERLNDAAWNAVGPAFLGCAAALFSLMPVAVLLGDPEFPPPLWLLIPTGIFSVACWGAAVRYLWLWDRAVQNVRNWREELERRQSGRTGA